jgi:hypothetical protein
MLITFSGAESTFTKTAKGGYSTLVVSYLNERGENKTWKLLSFSNPKVFDTFKNAKANTVYEITTRKNDKDFTEWASAEEKGEASMTVTTSPSKPASVSNYETREERNARQRLIVRQSCLAQALALSSVGAKSPPDPENVLVLADRFVAWVFEAPGLFEEEAE